MSVSRLRKEQRHTWLTVDAATVRLIRHADALAVWILLLNSPDDWIVRRSWLQKELGIGSIRLRAAVARLEALGLWERRPLRDAQGRLCGTEIVIREIPARPPSVQVPRHSENLDARGSSRLGDPRDSGKRPTTKRLRKNQEKYPLPNPSPQATVNPRPSVPRTIS